MLIHPPTNYVARYCSCGYYFVVCGCIPSVVKMPVISHLIFEAIKYQSPNELNSECKDFVINAGDYISSVSKSTHSHSLSHSLSSCDTSLVRLQVNPQNHSGTQCENASFIQLHTTLPATIPQVLPLPAQLDGVAVVGGIGRRYYYSLPERDRELI